ncbi:MAG TPA: hypothetical protein VFS26_03920, partial [Solirubrobacterales bacterium]|nr:hypothetical protein [Solirubrobacterales bacterium]
TAVGYLPITAIAVYFGTRLEGLSLTDPLVLGSALALLLLLAIGHWAMRRQTRSPRPQPPASADPFDPEPEDSWSRVD